LAADSGIKPEINEQEMSATFVISTPRIDRYGDSVIPRSAEKNITNFKKNPVVFFNHKTSEFPIGMARRNKESPVEIQINESDIRSKCYFHGLTEESELVFKLVKAGCLGTASIGFLPVVAAIIKDPDDPERDEVNSLGEDLIHFGDRNLKSFPSLRFHEIDLTEWSITSVPANTEAIAMHLSRGHIEGQAITTTLRKSLEPYAAPLKVWSPGALFSTPETKSMSEPTPEPTPEQKSAASAPVEVVEAVSTVQEKEVTPVPQTDKPAVEDPEKGWPYGAKFLSKYLSGCNDTMKWMDEACRELDQPRIKKLADKKMGKLANEVYKITKLAAQLYPEKFADPGEISGKAKAYQDQLAQKNVVVEKVAEVVEPVLERAAPEEPKAPEISAEMWAEAMSKIKETSSEITKLGEQFYSLTGKES